MGTEFIIFFYYPFNVHWISLMMETAFPSRCIHCYEDSEILNLLFLALLLLIYTLFTETLINLCNPTHLTMTELTFDGVNSLGRKARRREAKQKEEINCKWWAFFPLLILCCHDDTWFSLHLILSQTLS